MAGEETLPYDARRRMDLLLAEVRTAKSHTIERGPRGMLVRVELADGSRRISMLTNDEHAYFERKLDEGPPKLATAFGVLERYELTPSWHGPFEGIDVRIFGPVDIAPDVLAALELAIASAIAEETLARVRTAIGDRLYRLYRTTWCPTGVEPVERSAFEATVKLRGVSTNDHAPARVSLEWDDADFFAGHSILVTLDGGDVVDVTI